MTIGELIIRTDLDGIRKALTEDPTLANREIASGDTNSELAHPLHRICDGVISGKYTDEEAESIAEVFLQHGARVDGNEVPEKKDTPLIAAASLHADRVAMLYMDHGADITHRGTHGGTALHWAAWCGRPELVSKLIEAGASVDQKCIDFKSTPLFWAIHGARENRATNHPAYIAVVRLLTAAGADRNTVNYEGTSALDLLGENDGQMKAVLAG